MQGEEVTVLRIDEECCIIAWKEMQIAFTGEVEPVDLKKGDICTVKEFSLGGKHKLVLERRQNVRE